MCIFANHHVRWKAVYITRLINSCAGTLDSARLKLYFPWDICTKEQDVSRLIKKCQRKIKSIS